MKDEFKYVVEYRTPKGVRMTRPFDNLSAAEFCEIMIPYEAKIIKIKIMDKANNREVLI